MVGAGADAANQRAAPGQPSRQVMGAGFVARDMDNTDVAHLRLP
jgi:hypothetical protein